MRRIWTILLVALAAATACGETQGAGERGETWNEGVDYYRAGDVTNALRVLRPLMLTKSHGARAAEIVAKLEHERGNREEAAVAAQIALRAAPDDARANRNFTRAVAGLAEDRESRHIDEVLKSLGGREPGALMRHTAGEARALLSEAGTFATNAPVRAVALSDALSARALALSDAWIVLKEAVAASVTNAETAATIVEQVDAARAASRAAARQLADMDEAAYASLSQVEHDSCRFLKMTAMPPVALDEGFAAQSNAWQDVESFNGHDWQQDALDYTRAFRAKFPEWAIAREQAAQADTNAPPFSAEDQARISALATELEKLQLECVKSPLPPSQEKALEIMEEFRRLMPQDKGGSEGQQPESGQQNPEGGNGNDSSGDQQQGQQDDSPGENAENNEASDEAEGEEPQEDDGKADDDREVEAVIKRAEERSDEHEADKKARMRKAPLPPNERDW